MTLARPRAVLISGAPGVGKSTVSAIVATRLRRAAHIEADELHRMIVIGGEWPSAGTTESHRQLLLRTRNAAQVAANFVVAGFTPIVDEVISVADQLSIVDDVLGSDIDVVALCASESIVLARDAARKKHVAARYSGVAELVAQLLADRAAFIETSGLTAESTADAIQLALPQHEWTPTPFIR
jgi:predicted kinase